MSDTDNRQNRPEPIDWGKRLREFMDRQAQTDKHDTPPEAARSARSREQDDLDAKLIEQLRRSSAGSSGQKPKKQPQSIGTAAPAAADEPIPDEEPVEVEKSVEVMEPVKDKAPVEDEAPVEVEEPIEVMGPVKDETPAEDETPVGEEQSVDAVVSSYREPEPEPGNAPVVTISRRPARDDLLNGTSVADLISSGEFLENLDPETQAKVRAIWERKAHPAPEADAPVTDSPAIKADRTIPEPEAAEPTPAPVVPPVPVEKPPEAAPSAASAPAAPAAAEPAPAAPAADVSAPAGVQTGNAPARPVKPSTKPSTGNRAPAPDPMQISLNTTFRMIDAGLYPDETPSRTPSGTTSGTQPLTSARPAGARPAQPDDRPKKAEACPRIQGASDPRRPSSTVKSTDTSRETEAADTDLYLNLGYENELRRTAAGSDKADYVQNLQAAARPVGTRNAPPFAYAGKEYRSRSMTAGIETDYRRARLLALLRVTAAAIGALILTIYDLLPLMEHNGSLPTGLAYSGRYHVIELILLLLFAAPSASRMLYGLRGLWDFEPVRFSVPALTFSLTLVYDVIAGLLAHNYGMPLYGGAVLLILTLASTADALSLLSQIRAFRIVSSGIARYVLTPVSHAAGAEHERSEERSSVTVRACRTRLVSDFFARAEQYNAHLSLLNALLPVVLLISLLVGGAGILLSGTPDAGNKPAAVLLSVGLPLLMGTFIAGMPAAYVLSLSLPVFISNRLLAKHGCAVIGEAAPEQYVPQTPDGTTRLILPDGQALQVRNPQEFTDKKDPNAEHWSDMAHKLFALTDCSLRSIGERITLKELDGIRIELSDSANGLLDLHMTDAASGESHRVMAGSYGDLARHGVPMPASDDASVYRDTPSASVMYLSFDQHLRAVCSMMYEPEPMLQKAVGALAREGCRVSLLSYDPTLTRDVLARIGVQNVDLLRPKLYSSLYAPRSGAAVATSSGFDLCRAWLACKRMHLSYRRSRVFGWLSCVCAGLCLGICCLCGIGNAMLPAVAALWPLLTGVTALILTRATVTVQSVELGNNDEDIF